MLRWRLILKKYDSDIEYIKADKNIVIDALSRFPINGNPDTPQESTYQKEKFQQSITPKNNLKVFTHQFKTDGPLSMEIPLYKGKI